MLCLLLFLFRLFVPPFFADAFSWNSATSLTDNVGEYITPPKYRKVLVQRDMFSFPASNLCGKVYMPEHFLGVPSAYQIFST